MDSKPIPLTISHKAHALLIEICRRGAYIKRKATILCISTSTFIGKEYE